MADEVKNDRPSGWTRIVQHFRAALWFPLKTTVCLVLLAVAGVEALLAPFLGVKWAIFSLATAGCAIGFILALAGVWTQYIGNLAEQIHGQLISLHDEELSKLQPQRRAAPEKPFSGRIN